MAANPAGTQVAPSAPSWVTGILSGVEAPFSQNNINKLAAWNDCEGNDNGSSGLGINNPFNTTLPAGGASSVNSDGVKWYATLADGIAATLATLQASRYKGVVSNLQQDGSTSDFAAAVGSSGWGTSGSCIASKLGTSAALTAAAGGASGPGGSTSATELAAKTAGGCSGCFVSLPSVDLYVTSVGGGCLISNCEVKALKGGLIMLGGALIFGVGALVLVAYGFQRTGIASAAGSALNTVSKVTPAGRGLSVARGAGQAATSTASRAAGASTTAAASTSAPRAQAAASRPRSAPSGSTRQQRLLIRERERSAQGSHLRSMERAEQRTTHAAYRRQTGQRAPSVRADEIPFDELV
jgi:hypothetical protein